MGTAGHDAKQFTPDELKVINEALIFTLNCLDREQVQLYNSIKLVLAKTTGLLKED
ncbi:MAG: hypothetical protein WCA39_13885 [Nitrososphaeraceae archaeon]|jgi:hypothetical protein